MVTSTKGGLIPILITLSLPTQPFKVGITLIVPSDNTVVAIVFTSLPNALLPEIVAETVEALTVHVLGNVHE